MSARDTTEVVVVGAGHNGLVAAAYLARAGIATTVVEARPTVGGCSSTVDAIGARVNICNCDHLSVRSMPFLEELDLGSHGLEYLDIDPTWACVGWDDCDAPALFFSSVEATLEQLARTHPGEVDGYRRFAAAAVPAARLALELGGKPPSALTALTSTARSARIKSAAATTLLRWSRKSAADVLRSYFRSETILSAAAATGPVVWGVGPSTPGTGLGALALAMKHAVTPGRPRGGSGALTDSIADSFRAAGGEIKTGWPVSRILTGGDRVIGVESTHGDRLLAGHVLLACDPRVPLSRWLGDDPPPSSARLVERWQTRPAADGYESKIDALVTTPPIFESLHAVAPPGVDVRGVTTVVAPTFSGIDDARRDADAGRVSARPVMLSNVASVDDPSLRGPKNEHLLSLEVLFTPYELAGGWSGSAEPRRWLDLLAERVAPGLLDGLGDWRAMTPDRYESEFHMPRGYAQSFAGGPLAALWGGRDRELTRYETPLTGLLVTGAATFPGAGIWGASGRNAALAVSKDLGHHLL